MSALACAIAFTAPLREIQEDIGWRPDQTSSNRRPAEWAGILIAQSRFHADAILNYIEQQ